MFIPVQTKLLHLRFKFRSAFLSLMGILKPKVFKKYTFNVQRIRFLKAYFYLQTTNAVIEDSGLIPKPNQFDRVLRHANLLQPRYVSKLRIKYV